DEDPDARTIPVRDFEAEVVRLENLTHDVKEAETNITSFNDLLQLHNGIHRKRPGLTSLY
ncbi:MAG: hypothetical protein KZQ79_00640, partial [Candidatus Thiodiazotropha sp. (ex Lucinoma borealis)]|nr:hypothetical protein [Candidatus Thiodiazotropha sp. (ex Lucinoma borealis)]